MPMSPSLFVLPRNLRIQLEEYQPHSLLTTGWIALVLCKEFPYVLGSSNPWPNAVLTEPFSTSVFKVLIWIFATTTKICTKHSSTQTHVKGFCTMLTPSYSSKPHICSDGWVSVSRFSAIHFQGYVIRQVSYYTLLSGFRLPGPPSCCLYYITPFMVSDEREFWHLSSALGSSLIASSAYQKRPTWNNAFCLNVQLRNAKLLPI